MDLGHPVIEQADDLYESTIRKLPASQRIRLATRILADIPPQSVVDYDDEWSEEDMRSITSASLYRFEQEEGEDRVA